MTQMQPIVGFIGQGYIGRNYADSFEDRGFSVVRYALEGPYLDNKSKISNCSVVFIAVPTPTTHNDSDISIVQEVLALVPAGATAIIKSTILPGTTEALQKKFPGIFLLHSPEFLSEKTARHDVDHPDVTVIGVPVDTPEYRQKAAYILSILPVSPTIVCSSKESEFVKYVHNIHGVIEIVYANLLYDLAQQMGVAWNVVQEYIGHDRYMVARYATPVHASAHSSALGRGAGGHCFIKDFAAFRKFFEEHSGDKVGSTLLRSIEEKNIQLLVTSGKDIDLLRKTYGDSFTKYN